MIDGLTRLLLEKYSPSNPALQESPQRSPTPSTEPLAKSLRVVMDAAIVPPDLVEAALLAHNRVPENRPDMARHFILPVTTQGILAGSWVTYNESEEPNYP